MESDWMICRTEQHQLRHFLSRSRRTQRQTQSTFTSCKIMVSKLCKAGKPGSVSETG